MKVLLTGSTGFVGQALLARLAAQPALDLVAVSRRPAFGLPAGVAHAQVADIAADTAWQPVLQGVQVVIHAAARVHVMNDKVAGPLAEFRKVNVDGTLNLARQAVGAGVKCFIFISSIKVNGENTAPGKPYSAESQPAPVDPYGISKLEAELALRELAAETGMEVVIIRPPLVYGPDVKANFLSMMRWLSKGIPLPLGAIQNRRSLVALDNLVDLIATCVEHPAAANQTFMVSDGEDLSTRQLLRRMGGALGRPARLVPIPAWLLEAGASLLGKRALAQRLCGSLQVDISKTRELLNWSPPLGVDAALRRAAEHFLEHQAE
ncbi:SDR family oxidoreductase [Pseudomonas chengduensis]|nr:SDR family oxidoreductase [Pseudomonas chengduensis]MDH0625439.1 SDR family oxidoreductase [Pseudomonas chengduensis]MDH1667214.1 SDR family oxidoreductase [Pseudomonas chengduensis]